MKYLKPDDNRYRSRFMRATEELMDSMTVKQFISYLEENAELEDDEEHEWIGGKVVNCKAYDLKEAGSNLHKEFLVTEDGRLFYWLSLNQRIELVDQDEQNKEESEMMTTKEQERKALEKIRKIVEELGEDSYIGMAFEGCFEIAEENIDNDFGCSMKQRMDAAITKTENLSNEIIDLKKKLAEAKDEVEIKDMKIRGLRDERDQIVAKSLRNADAAEENWNKFREQEERADRAEAEIIQLKAKLYDLLITKK